MQVLLHSKQKPEELLIKTGLSSAQVKVWFQKGRTKNEKTDTFDDRRNTEGNGMQKQRTIHGVEAGNPKGTEEVEKVKEA